MTQLVGIPVLCVVVLFSVINLGPQGRPIETQALVVETEGTTFDANTVCDLRVDQARRIGGFNCRVTIVCAGETIYGGERLGGFLRCDAVAGHYLGGVDDHEFDGDPAIDLDLMSGEVEVRAAFPQPHRVRMRLR